ncbi:MAG: hypothetical protein IT322_21085 [Anaerolineae bacterium]|nr:hypothetical protein [Anaerolineae bacterium]
MDQRTTFRYLTAILSLVVACAALAVLAPGRAQEGVPAPLYLRVAAGDAAGLALAIQTANHTPQTSTHIYLEGGSYAFSADGLVLPPFSGHLVVYGNQAALLLDRTPLVVHEGGQVELRHLNLRWEGGQDRGLFNEGILSLRDSTLSADENLTPEGGGILNRGQLTLARVSLNTLRRISSTDPGGAVYNAGTFSAQCAAFSDNHASQGGAIYNAEGGTSTVSDSVFEGNSANGGGAIFNADASTLQALNNFWGGGAPLLEDLYRSTDTISSGVLVHPFHTSNPLELPGCATPPPDPIPAEAILSSCTSGGFTTPQPPIGNEPPSIPSPLICSAPLPVPVENAPVPASTVVVTRIDDRNNPTCPSDDCSLREAIRTAPNGAVITFDAAISAPIVLTQPIRITGKTLTLQGRLDQPTIISGNDQFNLFILNESNTQRVSLTIEYLTLMRGRAVVPNNGGAIYARDSFLILRNSTLHHHRATQNGGALYTEASTVYLTNVTLANNIAGTWGGAINNNRGMYTLTNTTIIDNQALGGYGGGVYSYVPVQQAVIHLYNSLVARNTPGGNCTGDVFGDYNVITVDGGDRSSPCGQYGTHNREVTRAQLGVQEADSTGALRDNGGPTLTVAILLPTSPLIDAADPNRCPLTDQRGVARVGICDVGGVEYTLAQATPTPTLSSTLITVYTDCQGLNLRDNPAGNVIGTIAPGVRIHLDNSSKVSLNNGADWWYRVRVDISQNSSGTPMPNAEGWIARKLGGNYLVFDYDRSPNCNLTPTAIMTQTPRPTICQLTAVNQKIHFFRAPIRGNPAEARETAGNPDLTIDAYAIDPLNHRLWFRRTEGVSQAPNGFILRWFQVIEPTGGFILPQEGIIVPKEDFDGVQSLTMARDQIEACLSTLTSANLSGHYALPSLDQVPWELTSPLTFSHYPVSMYQTCVASDMPHISGFADADGYFPPGYHFGVDFFAPAGSVAFASAGGLVVALLHEQETTGARWGNYKPVEISPYEKLSPFAVVIRHGHLFVVYGHLMTVDPNIWVGKYVEAGTSLGIVGTWNTPHLHLSVMSFGRTPPDASITWAQEVDPQNPQAPKANRWGIPDFQRGTGGVPIGRPNHVYDFTQFFEPDPVLLATYQATVIATGTPNTLEQPIHRAFIRAEDNMSAIAQTATVMMLAEGLGGTHRSIVTLGFPCERSYSQRFPEPIGWRYVNPIITPTVLPRHRSFIFYPNTSSNWTPAPADDPRIAITAPNLQPIPTLTPTSTP